IMFFFFLQAEDGIRDRNVTGVQTCALPISLLEAMNERQVTIDGRSHALPNPFMVIATQNPVEHHGTYPLPESQLDRFLMRLRMGYPDAASERDILRNFANPSEAVERVLTAEHILQLQALVH